MQFNVFIQIYVFMQQYAIMYNSNNVYLYLLVEYWDIPIIDHMSVFFCRFSSQGIYAIQCGVSFNIRILVPEDKRC